MERRFPIDEEEEEENSKSVNRELFGWLRAVN